MADDDKTILRKHFVTFLSPGTFVAEERTMEIAACDPDLAKTMAKDVVERYGATPYAFYFTTRERGPNDFDSRQVSRSPGCYYLGGKIETLQEIVARGDPAERILIENMKQQNIDQVIVTNNSWRWTEPFHPDKDVLLQFEPEFEPVNAHRLHL